MEKLQKLPIGKSAFDSIRRNNELYVDKTRPIFQLVEAGDYYFLSRPRRFGKSLTISTLKCLFQGRKELFDGLWIAENTDWEWKEHPVVSIDFNGITQDTPENLTLSLTEHLRRMAAENDIQFISSLPKGMFAELILSLHRKAGMPVVVLIDEYDKPIIDHLGKGAEHLDIAKANRDILKSFFGVLKEGDVSAALRLVFITGVSKFSRVSIFSELNNLKDLTMNRHYAEFLGYTQEELESCFTEHIERFSEELGRTPEQVIDNLRQFYNGYRFSEKDVRVYNPFSVLKSLDEMALKSYWFETGTPTFLVNLIRETGYSVPKIEDMKATEIMFSTYDLDDLKLEALLFQTGYVTIKETGELVYTFGYPNREVKVAFLETLFHAYSKGLPDKTRFALLAEYLLADDLDAFFETVRAIFADIPYTLEIKRDEAYFHTLFYLMVSASGVNARSEVLTCDGRIDMVMEFADKLCIIEFKCNQSAETAIRQIHENRYAESYRQSGKQIILMGINFNTEARNISEWRVE